MDKFIPPQSPLYIMIHDLTGGIELFLSPTFLVFSVCVSLHSIAFLKTRFCLKQLSIVLILEAVCWKECGVKHIFCSVESVGGQEDKSDAFKTGFPGCPGSPSVDQTQRSACFCLLSAGIKSLCFYHYCHEICFVLFCFLRSIYLCIYISTLLTCMPTRQEGIRSHYKSLWWSSVWLLESELRTFGIAVSALNRWAISPTPQKI